MATSEHAARLQELGAPVFVTDDEEWRIAGIEQTGGRPDAALVLSRGGAVAVRTELLSRPAQPRWVDVKTVQYASVHRPDATPAEIDAVEVEDAHGVLIVDGKAMEVVGLRSRQTQSKSLTGEIFLCRLELGGRQVSVAGPYSEFTELRLRTLSDLKSARW